MVNLNAELQKLKKKNQGSLYLRTIKNWKYEPNFFMSETYFKHKDFKEYTKKGWVWVEDDITPVFPALPYRFLRSSKSPITEFWASIHDCWINPTNRLKFLDYQYIYNPKSFLNMEGKEWAAFRKNSKKFPNRNLNTIYTEFRNDKSIRELLAEWMENNSSNVMDAEFIAKCILYPSKADYIKYLYSGDRLIAINYADENYKYINYRFLICRKEPFADEYARFIFYTDPIIQNKNKLVNDGGCLGFEGLEKFKDKLNPVSKVKIYSQIKN